MRILGIIPARFASTRFPGKPLVMIHGKTMIQRVFEQASKAGLLQDVVVATDDERIYNEVIAFGGKALITKADHPSGTDRCMEALELFEGDFDAVVNIQGDEPFIFPEQIDQLATILIEKEAGIATLAKKINSDEELLNPNVVKVIMNEKGRAIYFSRYPIPFLRGVETTHKVDQYNFFKHLGLYAYRTEILRDIMKLPVSSLEKAESLEQLRWLENNYSVYVGITDKENFGIDSPEDLKNLPNLF